MSLPEQAIEPVPEDTAQVARKAFPKGNPYIQMRDMLGTIYTDDGFADLYPQDGQPAIRPWRLALVTIMQFAENLTDRQAAETVRDRIAWKYALSLSLTDAGFDYLVLCEFRQRLLDHEVAQQLLNVMLERFAEQGWLKSRGKQRSDSTHNLAAIRRLNQLDWPLKHQLGSGNGSMRIGSIPTASAPATTCSRRKMPSAKPGQSKSDKMVCICCSRSMRVLITPNWHNYLL